MNLKKKMSEEDLGAEIVFPLGPVANMHLPDPVLRDHYLDEKNRIYRLECDVDDCTLDLVDFIVKCNLEDKDIPVDQRKPIRIIINSRGGDSLVAVTVVNAIRISKTPVWTINKCKAYSAGGIILMAGHKRFGFDGSSVIVHRGSVALSGEVSVVISAQKFYEKLDEKIEDFIFSKTKISKNFYQKKASSDIYYDAQDSLKYGIIDEVIQDLEKVFA